MNFIIGKNLLHFFFLHISRYFYCRYSNDTIFVLFCFVFYIYYASIYPLNLIFHSLNTNTRPTRPARSLIYFFVTYLYRVIQQEIVFFLFGVLIS